MKKKIKKQSLIRYVILLLISLIPTVITSFTFYKINFNSDSESIAKTLEMIGRRQVSTIIEWKEEFFYDLNTLAHVDCFINLEKDDISKVLEYVKFNKPVFREIYVIDKNGNFIYGYINNKKEFINSFVVRNALGGVEKISDVFKSDGKLYFDVGTPIFKEEEIVGAICARIDLMYLSILMKAIEKDDGIESFIVSKDGIFLTESRYYPDAIGNLKIDIQKIKTSIDFSKTIPYKDYRGKDVYGCYFDINDTGWILLVQKDADEVKNSNKNILDIGKYTAIFQIIGLAALKKLKDENLIDNSILDVIEKQYKDEKKADK
ncbi:hypothetical protein ABG79_00485 [Caloramator mitchellensis]|uniref:Cache domain-containing protein n=1 Tax=Caloramator mitchellensis TaxID=908809 RepID=A0A0R3K2N7_CALMK|nr:cache domain-containing protein [Caloramator mitchellensis]KRQ87684.1 hypothetical protein ABG79_00485 [Caloramator mitchellensis]